MLREGRISTGVSSRAGCPKSKLVVVEFMVEFMAVMWKKKPPLRFHPEGRLFSGRVMKRTAGFLPRRMQSHCGRTYPRHPAGKGYEVKASFIAANASARRIPTST